jgi:hypothetical protein
MRESLMAHTTSPHAPVAQEQVQRPSEPSRHPAWWWVFGGAVAVLSWLGWAAVAPTLGLPPLAPAAMVNRALHIDVGSRWGWGGVILALAFAAAGYAIAVSEGLLRPSLRSGLVFGAAMWLVVGALAMPLLAVAAPDSLDARVGAGGLTSGMAVPTDPEAMRPTFMMLNLGILAPLSALVGWLLFGSVLGATGSVLEPSVVVLGGDRHKGVRGFALIAGAAVLVLIAGSLWAISHPVEAQALDCGPGFGKKITGTVVGDVEVRAHGTVCAIKGTVKGNVTVRDVSDACTKRTLLTAINVVGGTIEGDIQAEGRRCVMVWVRDGSRVEGNIDYQARGNLGFLGNEEGATVTGDVRAGSGTLFATGASTTNHIGGDLLCDEALPVGGAGSGSSTDWDGTDDDADGTIVGVYRC